MDSVDQFFLDVHKHLVLTLTQRYSVYFNRGGEKNRKYSHLRNYYLRIWTQKNESGGCPHLMIRWAAYW